jgi:glycosyltransferase involved in cell wall biosynthesis
MARQGSDGSHLRIAVDAMPLIGERTGIGHVTSQLLNGLADRDDVTAVGYAVSRTGHQALRGRLPQGARAATRWMPARLAMTMWQRVGWPRIEHWTGPVDIVHATNFVAPPARAPVVLTVHDLVFVRHPDLCRAETVRYYEPFVPTAIERGATVHVVSDFVGQEVREVYGIAPERVVRVYFGITARPGGDAAAGRRLAAADRYIVALGTIEPRKNLPRLVHAFDLVASRDPDIHLVVAGPDGWGVEEFDSACSAARASDRIARVGYISDVERWDLLSGATLLAYPSLYEGFGHPPLEAMACGIPVVASAAASLPEVLGNAAVFVDPMDVDDIAAGLERVLSDVELRAKLVDLGREQVARYTWPSAIDEMVALYRRLADSNVRSS